MDYIYTNNQLEKIITELFTSRGHYETDPLLSFFFLIDETESANKIFKLLRKYFEQYTSKTEPRTGNFYEMLWEGILRQHYKSRDWLSRLQISKNMFGYDSLNGLAYFLAKNLLEFEEGGLGLDYVKIEVFSDNIFYFFDRDMKLFIGKVSTVKKGKTLRIQTTAAERKLIGMGYGLKMYLTVMQNCDYLISDTTLFSGSLRIWRDILPKYVNVWYQDDLDKYTEIIPGERPPLGKISRFAGSIKKTKPPKS